MISMNMMNRSVFFITVWLGLMVAGNLWGKFDRSKAEKYYKVEQTSQGLRISFFFPELRMAPADADPDGGQLLQIDGLSMNYTSGEPLVPVIILPIARPHCEVELQIQVEAVEEIPDIRPVRFAGSPESLQNVAANPVKFRHFPDHSMDNSASPPPVADWTDCGLFRDYSIGRLRISPVQVTDTGIQFYKKFAVHLKYRELSPGEKSIPPAEAALLRRLVINDEQLHLLTPASRPQIKQPSPGNSLPETLRAPANLAEYLLIAPPGLRQAAEALKIHREQQGVAVALIDAQEIYDAFSGGEPAPEAIREFLRYAFYHWQTEPRVKYALLFGSIADPRTAAATRHSLPTYLMKSRSGEWIQTDAPFSRLSGEDAVPDLFVGRIPAATPEEAMSAVHKIIEYETRPLRSEWRARVVVADIPSASHSANFSLRGKQIQSASFPDEISVLCPTAPREGTAGLDMAEGTDIGLVNLWNNGVLLAHLAGGTGAERLFRPADVDLLTNQGMYPFVLTSRGAAPYGGPDWLQAFVLAENCGAIGGIVTGDGKAPESDSFLLPAITRFLFEPSNTFGEALVFAQIYSPTPWEGRTTGPAEAEQTPGGSPASYPAYLIGDPLGRLQIVENSLPVALDSELLQDGDTLHTTLYLPETKNSGYVELADAGNRIFSRIPLFDVSDSVTVQMPIPAGFPAGEGTVRTYFSDGNRDMSGSARFFVNRASLTALTWQPKQPLADDSVRVHLQIRDRRDIRSVRILLRETGQEIPANPDARDPMQFHARIGPSGRSDSVHFDVAVENESGKVSLISGLAYPVQDPRPDLFPVAGSLHLFGKRTAMLKLQVANAGGGGPRGTVPFLVLFARGYENLRSGNFFAVTEGAVGANSSVEVSATCPLEFSPTPLDIFALTRVPSAENGDDFNSANDTLHTLLVPEIFTVFPQQELEIALAEKGYRVRIPPGWLSDTAAVQIGTVDVPSPANSSGLRPLLLAGDSLTALQVQVLNPAARMQLPFEIEVNLPLGRREAAQKSFSEIALLGKSNLTQPWIFTDFSGDSASGRISATASHSGYFAPFAVGHNRSPQIAMSVNGKPLIHGMRIPSNAAIQLDIWDGLLLDSEKVRVTLDGVPISTEKISLSKASPFQDNVQFRIAGDLPAGPHQLAVETEDINGNTVRRQIELTAAPADFDVVIYGNYPNPFSDRTTFAYFVQAADGLDDFEIRIYTVSGRLVRVIDSDPNNLPNAPDGGVLRSGYNEIIWEGTDSEGNLVANGLYFAIIRAVYQGDVIEKILKVAKLR